MMRRLAFVVAPVLAGALVAGPAGGAPATCGLAAHRGDHTSASRTENSRGAFRQAIADGADYLETDVRADRQGTLWLMHDPTVDRTTNGTGRIRKMSTAQVRALRLDDGSRVPRLSTLLRIASTSATVDVIPELKAMGTDLDNYRDYAQQVRAFGRGRVIASSFDTDQLARLRSVAPHIRQSIIEGKRLLTPAEVKPYNTVTIKYTLVTDEWLDSMPYPVFIYTPDSPDQWHYANRVRGVVTDDPVGFKAYQGTVCTAT